MAATAKNLARRLRRARVRAGMGIRETARILRITRQTIISWERAKCMPRVDVYLRLMELYGVPTDLERSTVPKSRGSVALSPETRS